VVGGLSAVGTGGAAADGRSGVDARGFVRTVAGTFARGARASACATAPMGRADHHRAGAFRSSDVAGLALALARLVAAETVDARALKARGVLGARFAHRDLALALARGGAPRLVGALGGGIASRRAHGALAEIGRAIDAVVVGHARAGSVADLAGDVVAHASGSSASLAGRVQATATESVAGSALEAGSGRVDIAVVVRVGVIHRWAALAVGFRRRVLLRRAAARLAQAHARGHAADAVDAEPGEALLVGLTGEALGELGAALAESVAERLADAFGIGDAGGSAMIALAEIR